MTVWSFRAEGAEDAMRARPQFKTVLCKIADDDSIAFVLELIFSELVANVMRHAPGPILVELQVYGERARLQVHDTGPGFHGSVVPPQDPLAEHGRGLYLVSRLAERLDVERRDGETVVSAEVPLKAA
jgi:anti-sigma regulatory factor (Ser/Thr protein kinase)